MSSLFLAVQFEFTHAIGPHAGRYVVAHPAHVDDQGAARKAERLGRRERLTGVTMNPATADVLAISVREAAAAKAFTLRRRAKEHDVDAEAAKVPLLLATFIRGTEPIADEDAAAQRLLAIASEEDEQAVWIRDGLAVINRAIRAYRVGARDPYVTEIDRRAARAVRVGFGTTEGLPDGNFIRAAELPPPLGGRSTRTERLLPAESTADILAGRAELLDGEDLLLRVYIDLDHGRPAAAAVQLRAALELLALERPELDLAEPARRTAEFTLDRVNVDAVEDVLAQVESALET